MKEQLTACCSLWAYSFGERKKLRYAAFDAFCVQIGQLFDFLKIREIWFYHWKPSIKICSLHHCASFGISCFWIGHLFQPIKNIRKTRFRQFRRKMSCKSKYRRIFEEASWLVPWGLEHLSQKKGFKNYETFHQDGICFAVLVVI